MTGAALWVAAALAPILVVVIAGASWMAVRRERQRLGFLQGTALALLEARDPEAASVELLRRASRRFNAGCAELTLIADTGTQAAFRTTLRDMDPVDVMRSVGAEDDDGSALAPPIFGVVHIAAAASDPWVAQLAARLNISGGLAVTLRHCGRTVGYLALGVRRLERRSARADDQMLQELANLAALTIDRSRLHDALLRLTTLQSELADRAFHDPLTHLANRVLFVDRIERALLQHDPERHAVSVVHVALDGIRRINSEYGHANGDAVLIEVARRLHECLRRTDTAARLGGDEFALLLPEVLHPREAELIAQRVVEALADPIEIEGHELMVSASVGLACASVEGVTAALLLRNATDAAREAREAGLRGYRVHGGAAPGPGDPDLPLELEAALDNAEFVVHYQPIVELKTGRILGAEALVRWQHPARGLIPPLHFLPVAVECGLVDRIEAFVLRRACQQLRRWQHAYPATPELAISVNLSAGALGRADLVEQVTRCLEEVQVDPACLILEVTENAVLQDLHGTITAFDALQRAGVHVAIDDVGTGYTSLAYLRRLPIDILKIARPLVADLGDPNSSGELARTVVRHGEALRLALVAEGVETPLQVRRLNELGCAMAQGFHLARPCDAEAMEELLRRGWLDPAQFLRAAPLAAAAPRRKASPRRRVPSSSAAARNPA
ncbi:MAG TPA: EAL domain-containing protein [Candidatus Dormibacteraeota bacterium]